ncbi:hypothetical protein IFM53868_04404 [Aspergillus udagawae]|uniref:Uncharacterized protein n=1 Tax=Aspergillus udagawae TaxID=91492 RepID=A0A8H3NUU4_9EURO|nr:uncharacterized protein Aud_005025 [Aspergillus udagawae]GFF40061.1 hypothetical protein IFM46972_06092 [Aspergillus udagawae]GFF85210.1 hypothetical protein IFM53868_04404 [Aspergillus udagawae]GFG02684.1 hypothetical protein IFM5058_01059 [Aspergillus udagawae]GIC88629.1 hypothetical protein Aud_005025 [Aspergillus udagawae]
MSNHIIKPHEVRQEHDSKQMDQESPPAQVLSRLECLPVELLQKIFLHSLEFNLPRASICLARALSNLTLYTWLIRLAFSSSNESSKNGFFTPDFLPPPLDFSALSTEERSDLQSAILACRWCTLELMRKCQREYIEHAVRLKCRDLVFPPKDCDIIAKIGEHFHDLRRYDHGHQGRLGKGDLICRAQDPETNAEYRVAVWFNFGAFQIRKPNPIHTELDLFRLPCCAGETPSRMPDKLLCPPWTDTKIEFLKLLCTEVYIDEDEEFERSGRLLRQVIRSRDYGTFKVLVELFIRIRIYRYPLRWPIHRLHFKAALKYADSSNDPFLNFLVRERWDDLPSSDIRLKGELIAKVGMSSPA